MTTDPTRLLTNRIEYELAKNGVVVSDKAPTLVHVGLLDFWWEFRKSDFMDYRTTTTVRLLISLEAGGDAGRSWLVSGRGQQAERAAEPIPVAVDLLEVALDRSLLHAHELGAFRMIAESAAAADK